MWREDSLHPFNVEPPLLSPSEKATKHLQSINHYSAPITTISSGLCSAFFFPTPAFLKITHFHLFPTKEKLT